MNRALALCFALVAFLVAALGVRQAVIDPESCITVCNARVSRYAPFTCVCKR